MISPNGEPLRGYPSWEETRKRYEEVAQVLKARDKEPKFPDHVDFKLESPDAETPTLPDIDFSKLKPERMGAEIEAAVKRWTG